MQYVIPQSERATLEVVGSNAVFPVRRIYCIGRNYAEHTREMGGNPERTPPCFFTKPSDAIIASGSTIPYPQATQNLHHEVEMVLALGKGGADIEPKQALNHIYGYAVGIDFTRRDLQGEAKKAGAPWDTGKAFDNSAPCSAITPANAIGHLQTAAIWLQVNGELRQSADISQMIWSSAEIIGALSALFKLQPGDLIFTGTPAGVGAVQRGDHLLAGVEHLASLSVAIDR